MTADEKSETSGKAVTVMLFLAVVLVGGYLFMHAPVQTNIPESEQQKEDRAKKWLEFNVLKGTVSCQSDSGLCEVVPTDPRAPFWLDCSHRPCTLPLPSR